MESKNSSGYENLTEMAQVARDASRHQLLHITPHLKQFSNEGGGDGGEVRGGGEEEGLDAGVEEAVDTGDAVFVVPVGCVADAPEEGVDVETLAEVGGEAVVAEDLDTRIAGKATADGLHALLNAIEARLLTILTNGDDHPIEDGQSTLDNLLMPHSKGIEGSRKDDCSISHVQNFLSGQR